jgi:hypothetical protein
MHILLLEAELISAEKSMVYNLRAVFQNYDPYIINVSA